MASEISLTGPRKLVAGHMMKSLAGAAQLSFHAECDVTDLVERRAAWKAEGITVGLEDCLVAALTGAMQCFPQYNGTVQEGRLVGSDQVHIALAMPVNGLLLTPVLRDAHAKSLTEVSEERRELSGRAKAGGLKVSDMVGSTVTMSNLGLTAVHHFTPILNQGQVVLLGVGNIQSRLAFDAEGAVVERQMMGLSLTADHRFVDGEPAGQLLGEIIRMLIGMTLSSPTHE